MQSLNRDFSCVFFLANSVHFHYSKLFWITKWKFKWIICVCSFSTSTDCTVSDSESKRARFSDSQSPPVASSSSGATSLQVSVDSTTSQGSPGDQLAILQRLFPHQKPTLLHLLLQSFNNDLGKALEYILKCENSLHLPPLAGSEETPVPPAAGAESTSAAAGAHGSAFRPLWNPLLPRLDLSPYPLFPVTVGSVSYSNCPPGCAQCPPPFLPIMGTSHTPSEDGLKRDSD